MDQQRLEVRQFLGERKFCNTFYFTLAKSFEPEESLTCFMSCINAYICHFKVASFGSYLFSPSTFLCFPIFVFSSPKSFSVIRIAVNTSLCRILIV